MLELENKYVIIPEITKSLAYSSKRKQYFNAKESIQIMDYFSDHIEKKTIPTKQEIDDFIETNDYQDLSWTDIRDKVKEKIGNGKMDINEC